MQQVIDPFRLNYANDAGDLRALGAVGAFEGQRSQIEMSTEFSEHYHVDSS